MHFVFYHARSRILVAVPVFPRVGYRRLIMRAAQGLLTACVNFPLALWIGGLFGRVVVDKVVVKVVEVATYVGTRRAILNLVGGAVGNLDRRRDLGILIVVSTGIAQQGGVSSYRGKLGVVIDVVIEAGLLLACVSFYCELLISNIRLASRALRANKVSKVLLFDLFLRGSVGWAKGKRVTFIRPVRSGRLAAVFVDGLGFATCADGFWCVEWCLDWCVKGGGRPLGLRIAI